jgi:RNA polymerase sigma factor (sigma-70 family)
MDADAKYRWVADKILPHERRMQRWLAACGVSRQDVNDLMQDLYERLCEARLEDVGNPPAFAFQTLRNILTDRSRRAKVVQIDSMANLERIPDDDHEGPEHRAAVSQGFAMVLRVAKRMPRKQQDVFLMHFVYGCSVQEIAHCKGVSARTVENHMREAMMRVAREIPELKSPQQPNGKRRCAQQRRPPHEQD